MSPTSKDQRFRILSDVDGKLHLNKENLKNVVDEGIAFTMTKYPSLKVETLPVAILSVIGGALQDESFFFTNALRKYLKYPGYWCLDIKEENRYQKRLLLSKKKWQTSKDISSGVFIFSEPLVMDIENDEYQGPALVWLLYAHLCPASKHLDDDYGYETFLSLGSSGMMEIFKGDMKKLQLEELTKKWSEMDLSSEPKFSLKLLPKTICQNIIIIYRTHQSHCPDFTNILQAKVLCIDDSAKPFLDGEGKLKNNQCVEDYKHRLEEIMECVGNKLNLKGKQIFQFESDLHNTDQFQRDTMHFLRASDIVDFFESCVEIANEMKTKSEQIKEITTTQAEQKCVNSSSQLPKEATDTNTLFKAAVAIMTEQMMPFFMEKWKSIFFTVSVCTWQEVQADFKNYYDAECVPNLEAKYQHHFIFGWSRFSSRVFTELNKRFKMIFETLKNVNDNTEEIFKKFGYFSEANFEKIFQQSTEMYLKQHKNDDKMVMENLTFAISKLKTNKFKPHNEEVANEEQRLSQKIIYKIKRFYKREMSTYFEEYCVFAPEELEEIHNKLMEKFTNTFLKCCFFTAWDDLAFKIERVDENIKNLTSFFQISFTSIQQENLSKIEALGKRMINAVFSEKLEYRKQIKSILKDHPVGMAEIDMIEANKTVNKIVKENLKRKIFEIRKMEPMDLYLLALQEKNDFDWADALEKYKQKLNNNSAEMGVEAKEDDEEYFSAEEIFEEGDNTLFQTAQDYMAESSFKSQEWFTKLPKNQQELYSMCVEVEAQIEEIFNNGDASEMGKTLALDTVSMGKEIAMNESINRKEVAKAKELVKKYKKEETMK